MSTAFVAGATGYTGREVVAELRARGVRTIAHARPSSEHLAALRDTWKARGVEIDTSPWELEAITVALRQYRVTHVFALLGTTRHRAKAAAARGEDASYDAVDHGLSALLIDAAEASGRSPRFIYLSAAGVSASSVGAYYQARQRVEAKLEASSLSHAIARPMLITGDDRSEARPLERITAKVTDAGLRALSAVGAKHLHDRYASMDANTLARALVRLALDEPASGIFEAGQLRAISSAAPQS